MKEKFELAGVLAFLGTVLGGFTAFLNWSGIPADLAANYGAAVKDLFWVATMGALFVACLRFLICYERLGAGEAPLGSGPREKSRRRARRTPMRAGSALFSTGWTASSATPARRGRGRFCC